MRNISINIDDKNNKHNLTINGDFTYVELLGWLNTATLFIGQILTQKAPLDKCPESSNSDNK